MQSRCNITKKNIIILAYASFWRVPACTSHSAAGVCPLNHYWWSCQTKHRRDKCSRSQDHNSTGMTKIEEIVELRSLEGMWDVASSYTLCTMLDEAPTRINGYYKRSPWCNHRWWWFDKYHNLATYTNRSLLESGDICMIHLY